jgi:hypothetical protein
MDYINTISALYIFSLDYFKNVFGIKTKGFWIVTGPILYNFKSDFYRKKVFLSS